MDNLDPQALSLAKAIRKAETGSSQDPYNARGASGEFGGYQFMPDTYKALAKKHLGDENAPATVENQNKLAYSEVKALKDAGNSPAQIASIWNSGKPDSYKQGLKGTNSQGVQYDVPAYVAKVSQAYRELSGVQTAMASEETPQPSQQVQAPQQEVPQQEPKKPISTKIAEMTGFGKTVDTLGSLIARGQSQTNKNYIEAPTGKEVAGAALNVASLAVPVAAGERVAAGLAGRLAPKIAQTVGRVAAGGLVGLGTDVAQDLEAGRKVKPGLGTAIGAGIPIVGALGSKIAGRVAGESAGVLTGARYGPLKRGFEASKAGGEVGDAFSQALKGQIQPEQIVGEARDALGAIVGRRSSEYENLLSSMKGSSQQLDVTPIFKGFKEQLGKFGITGTPEALDFSRSVFRFNSQAQADIQKIASEMADFGLKEGDRTSVGVDRLKRSFANLYGENRDARALVEAMRGKTRDVLSKVEGYDKSMALYGDMTDAIDDIRKGLSLGDQASTDTAFKKIVSSLRQNQEFRKTLMDELDKETGGLLSAKVAGQQLSDWAPKGLIRSLIGTGSLGAIMTGMWPALSSLITTSPRVAGTLAKILGKTSRDFPIIEEALIKAATRGAQAVGE
ncbi:MAG: hypothetical protein IPP74_14500 [Alphaproteobacteria bacterium]|nr:hypothetical protein [Alphaproteobacteria bacterium]